MAGDALMASALKLSLPGGGAATQLPGDITETFKQPPFGFVSLLPLAQGPIKREAKKVGNQIRHDVKCHGVSTIETSAHALSVLYISVVRPAITIGIELMV